jgi:hypothetical protein
MKERNTLQPPEVECAFRMYSLLCINICGLEQQAYPVHKVLSDGKECIDEG